MNGDSKPWYASKGVWGGIIATLAPLVVVASHDKIRLLPADEDQLASLLAAGGAAIGGIVAIIGRLTAKKPIGGKPPSLNSNGVQT